jgi:hypothetical protein
MVARVARFENVNIQVAEQNMDQAEAVIRPMVEALTGYKGSIELMAKNGEMISITLFDSAENAETAEPTFDVEMPRKLGEIFDSWEGRRVAVGLFDVVADTRT